MPSKADLSLWLTPWLEAYVCFAEPINGLGSYDDAMAEERLIVPNSLESLQNELAEFVGRSLISLQ
jgi:hypothetical protein